MGNPSTPSALPRLARPLVDATEEERECRGDARWWSEGRGLSLDEALALAEIELRDKPAPTTVSVTSMRPAR